MRIMRYEQAYQAFISEQIESRSGESLRRLQEGHGYLEQLFLEQALIIFLRSTNSRAWKKSPDTWISLISAYLTASA